MTHSTGNRTGAPQRPARINPGPPVAKISRSNLLKRIYPPSPLTRRLSHDAQTRRPSDLDGIKTKHPHTRSPQQGQAQPRRLISAIIPLAISTRVGTNAWPDCNALPSTAKSSTYSWIIWFLNWRITNHSSADLIHPKRSARSRLTWNQKHGHVPDRRQVGW